MRVGPLALGLCLAVSEAAAQERAQQQAELEALRDRIQNLDSGLERDREQVRTLQQQIRATERELERQRLRLVELSEALDTRTGQLNESRLRLDAAALRLDGERKALAAQLRAAYEAPGQGAIPVLLTQDQPQDLGRLLVWLTYFNQARSERIRYARSDLQDLDAERGRLEQEQRLIAAQQQQQERAVVELREMQARHAVEVGALDMRIGKGESERQRLQEEERALRALLERLSRAPAPTAQPAQAAGPAPQGGAKALIGLDSLRWPLQGPLLARFGDDKAGGRLSWNGIWIAAPAEAPVHAAAAGRVAYVGWMQRFGLLLILEHPGGYFTLYGHNAASARRVGDWVAAGELIARAGNSGGHDRNGLYFELRKGADAINPLPYLAD